MSDPWDTGLYSQTEAARYTGIPLSTVHRWLERRVALPGDELATFDEFITLIFVRALRVRGVRFKDILTAERDLQERTGHLHPFVHETLWVAGRDVLVRLDEAPDAFLAVSRRGQLTIPGVTRADRVELPRLVADIRGQLSYIKGRVGAWRPAERIEARPLVQFGLTCIEGTRIPTQTLFDATSAGDDAPTLARLFAVTEADVERAVEWEMQLAA